METKNSPVTQPSVSQTNTDAVIALVVELLGGLIGVPGLGHVISGKFGLGILVFIGAVCYNMLSGFVAMLTFGCSFLVSYPIYLVGIVFSAVSVFKYMDNNKVKGDWKTLLIVVGAGFVLIIGLSFLLVLISMLLPLLFIGLSNH